MKRINLQIDKNTAEAFTRKAEKSGIPKSQLLRKWIQNIEFINFNLVPSINSYSNVSYTIRLPNELLVEIDDLATSKAMSRSVFLRTLIYFKLQPNETSGVVDNTNANLNSLWIHGKINQIDKYIQSKPDLPSFNENELIVGIRNSNESGKYNLSQSLLDELLKRKVNRVDWDVIVRYMAIDLNIMQRNYHKVEADLKAIEPYVMTSSGRQIQGSYYMYLGELRFYKDDLIASRNSFFKALSLFDSINHPLDMIRIYMRLGRLEECLVNFDMAQSYFNYAYQIAKNLDNKHCLGWFYNDYAFHFHLRDELDKADRYIQISNKCYSSVGNFKGISYNDDHKGRFLIQRNDFNGSQKYLDKACNFVNKFVTDSYFNYSNLFRLFIKSRNEYKSVERELRKMLTKNKGIKPGLGKYVYESIRYINSNDPTARHDAGIKLEFMKTNAAYPLLRNAARRTLITNKLAPVR